MRGENGHLLRINRRGNAIAYVDATPMGRPAGPSIPEKALGGPGWWK